MKRRCLSLLLAFAVLVGLPALAWAGPAETSLKEKQTDLFALIKKGKSAENEKKIEALFDTLLDYETLAKESLGPHWDDRSAEEKKEFQEVLKKLVRNAYRRNLKKTLAYDVAYNGEDEAKKGVLVKTVAKSKKNVREEPLSIDYLMHELDGKWVVYDLVTEGSSLVGNYKSQFGRVIKKNGFPELIKRMKRKLGKDAG